MNLHALRVAHWRGLIEATDLGPFSDRLNIIHAPNGTGKSSLFEAMRRALFDAHHVTGAEIEAVRPWGRPLSPQVMVEFSEGGERYRIEKTFLDGASSKLSRLENDRFVPLADGRNADSRLREILRATNAPGRGLSKSEHWGLAEILWAPQGSLTLKGLSPTASETLRGALGLELTGEGGNLLEELLEDRYLAVFTRQGKIRTGKEAAPIAALESELNEVRAQVQRCLEQYQSFEEASQAVKDARQRRTQFTREADALAEPLDQARSLAESYQRLQSDLGRLRGMEEAAREKFESIRRTIELIGATRQELADLQSQIQRDAAAFDELASELKAATGIAEARRRERDLARQRRTNLEKLEANLEDARHFLSERDAGQNLASRLDKVGRLQTRLSQAKQERSALVAPDDKTIRAVRSQLELRDKAQAAIQAALIRLTIQPDRDAEVIQEAQNRPQRIPAGQEFTFTGSPGVSLRIQGFGTIRATGPEPDVEAQRAEVAEAEQKLARLTQPFGSPDPDRLQSLREQAGDLDRTIATLESQLEELLDGQSPEKLRARLAEVNARQRERLGRFPSWAEAPPVLSDLQSALHRERRDTERVISEAEDLCESALNTRQNLEKRQTGLDGSLRNARQNLEGTARRLAELTRDGLTDDARQTARQEALMTWEAARTQASDCQRELTRIGDDPQITVRKLELQQKAHLQAEANTRDEEKQAEGRLQALASEGAYSKLAACQEKRDDLNARLRREQRRMAALRLLHDTIAQCKEAAVAAVAAPVERVATRMLLRVAGPRLGPVRLTGEFALRGTHPESVEEPVPVENLSGGEQEQLFLILRLALAEVLAKEERQLVVLDDVLTATDTGRLARMLTLLEEASERLQIVILTCHPERYRALEGAAFHGLRSP